MYIEDIYLLKLLNRVLGNITDMGDNITDQHTLYICHPKLTKEELRTLLSNYAQDLYNLLEIPNQELGIFVNAIYNKNSVNTGIAFVYCKDSKVYYAILGRNVDGTKRVDVKYLPNPNPIRSENWADDEEDIIEIKEKLPPLLPLPTSDKGPLKIAAAIVEEPDENKEFNVLICREFPTCMVKEDFMRITRPFSTMSDYPKVEVFGKIVRITYHPNTHDALFALHMLKCYPFKKADNLHKIYFALAFRKN